MEDILNKQLTDILVHLGKIDEKLDDIKSGQDVLGRDFKAHSLNDWAHGLGVLKWFAGGIGGLIITALGLWLEMRK